MKMQCILSSLEDDLSTYLVHDQVWPDVHPKVFAAHHLMNSIFKKFAVSSSKLEDDAFALFSDLNRRGFRLNQEGFSLCERSLLDQIAFEFEKYLRPLEKADDEWLDILALNGYHGTGKSTGVRETDSYHKLFCSRLTTSNPSLYPAYRRMTLKTGWYLAESQRQRQFGIEVVKGGKLTFVPKDVKRYRSIVTEPSLDMFFQLGLHNWLTDRTKSYGIDPENQWKKARRLACEGSAYGTYSTIDSTSASDTIYLGYLIDLGIIPEWFSSLIREIKSPLLCYKDKVLKISLIGTMGCGFTFALMTALLTCTVRAVYTSLGLDQSTDFSVWGDDVIVVTQAHERTMCALRLLGFLPNKEKSYAIGPFRESCGGDYYNGHHVRGIYCKSLDTRHDIYSLFNRLLAWSERHKIPLYHTLRLLYGYAPPNHIPLFEDIQAGFRIPLCFTQPKYDDNGSYRYYTYIAKSYTVKPRIMFPDAMVLCCIQGYVKGTRILTRCDNGHGYIRKSKVSPCWDHCSGETEEFPVSGYIKVLYSYILS